MILGSKDIIEYLNQGKIIIDPKPKSEQIDTTTVDLRFGKVLFEWNPDLFKKGVFTTIDIDDYNYKESAPSYMRSIPPNESGKFIIKPQHFYLGQTFEKVIRKNSYKWL